MGGVVNSLVLFARVTTDSFFNVIGKVYKWQPFVSHKCAIFIIFYLLSLLLNSQILLYCGIIIY